MIDLELIFQSLPKLLHGALVSLEITAIALIIGFIFGIIISLLETSKSHLWRWFAFIYVSLIRGTPMLVQILIVYYVLPQVGIHIPPFWAASCAIGVNSSAYISQIICSGINAVSHGQIESAKTLGFSHFSTMRYIVFPQAFRIAIPSLGNELITLVKDSSLASIIGVVELTKEGSIIRSHTYDAFSILLAVSLIYLAITLALSCCLKKIGGSYVEG